MRSPRPWQVGLILIIGVIAVSMAAIFIRLSLEASGQSGVGFSLFLAASRIIIAALVLVPTWRNFSQITVTPKAYYYGISAGLALGFHFATWITSLSFTSIVASTTLVTTNPVWVSLISWIWFQEKPTLRTIFGIIIALIGGIFIALGDTKGIPTGSNPLLGNILALVGAWMGSLYLVWGREAQREGLKVGSYIIIAYTTAAIALFPLPLLIGSGYFGYSPTVYGYVFLMAIFSQLIGHTSLNWAVRWISPTLVTLAILFEPVGASFLGFILFREVPSLVVITGAIILLLGVMIAAIDSYTEG